jgi:ribosomal protein S18 acetylase RimI-like enzyme
MGEVSFDSSRIPVHGPPREVLRETMVVDGQSFEYSAATIGNPHCVLVRDHALADEARRLGPLIETQPRFPNRTNVQFVEILDRHRIAIEIWERGAGYTLASGSSSCAAAAVAVRLGFCDSPLSVHMPGGTLSIKIDNQYRALMTGPVCKVADGQICREALEGTAGQAETDVFSLVPFDMRYAEIVQGWVRGRDEAAAWAGLSDEPLSPATFAHWHADQDVFGFVLLRKELPVGYGEVWLNSDPDAVELARIIVAPASRGRGIGRILIDKLTAETPAADSKMAFLRVRPGNSRALRCYEKAAFRRVPSEEASIYNQGQPVEYVWLRRSITK